MNTVRIREIARTVASDAPDLLRSLICFTLAYAIVAGV